ncbi:MAG TPA: endonuclease/exonuclease/phosphatase family protein [Pyrinomonadaceae bacterium]|nr:endonuclease/exonuclease/phosphatase family protein [Pyrinomonadaceae bacterium]
MSFKLLSYNVRYGGVGREPQLAAVVREADPDLVVFQEATDPRVVERLSEETGLKYRAAHGGNSVAYLSRVPVKRHEWHRPRGSRRHFMEIELEGPDLVVFGIHLSAVHSFWTERRRMRELRSLLAWVEARSHGFHVMVGDFNTLAPGELLDAQKLPPRLRALVWLSGGRVRYQTIQILLAAGYTDAFRRLHPEDLGYTFPTWDPHVRLDYVFTPKQYDERVTDCRVLTDNPKVREASDHFPLLATLET